MLRSSLTHLLCHSWEWRPAKIRRGTGGYKKSARSLLQHAFVQTVKIAERALGQLQQLRHSLLAKAAMKDGQVLLDVGAGEGLIAFGALEKLGTSGRVILADISRPLLDHAREAAERKGSQ